DGDGIGRQKGSVLSEPAKQLPAVPIGQPDVRNQDLAARFRNQMAGLVNRARERHVMPGALQVQFQAVQRVGVIFHNKDAELWLRRPRGHAKYMSEIISRINAAMRSLPA